MPKIILNGIDYANGIDQAKLAKIGDATLNTTAPDLSGAVNELKSNLVYNVGDTVTIGTIGLAGRFYDSGNKFLVTIPLDRPISTSITGCSVTGIGANGITFYLEGTNTYKGSALTYVRRSANMLTLYATVSNGVSSLANKVGIMANGDTFTITFTGD